MLPFIPQKKDLLNAGRIMLALLLIGVGGNENASAESEEIEHRNKVALFGGVTQQNSKFGGSIGLGYEYRIYKLWGVGGMAEFTRADVERRMAFGIGAYIHPYADLYFLLGPGVEFEDNEDSFTFRVGVGYDFELWPRRSLAPEFNVDFVSGGDTALVYF